MLPKECGFDDVHQGYVCTRKVATGYNHCTRHGGVSWAPLTFDEVRMENVARCEESFHPLNSLTAAEWLTALVEEIGEVATEIKKAIPGVRKFRPGGIDKEKLGQEIGDAVALLDLIAASQGIDTGEALRAKFNRVSEEVGSKRRL